MAGDLYYNNVSLLLHGDGSDGGTTFTDNSGTPKTPTLIGTPTTRTTTKQWGTASILANGTTDALSYAHTAALDLSTGDFTIESWIYVTSLATVRTIAQKDQSFGTTFPSYALQVSTTGELKGTVGTGNSAVYSQAITSAASLIAINTMYHVAFTRSGTTLRLFVGGTLVQTATQSGSPVDGAKAMLIGRLPAGGGAADAWMAGYLDDFRITKGIARYTASFAVPTEAFGDSAIPGSLTFAGSAPTPTLAAFGGATVVLSAPSALAAAFSAIRIDLTAPSPVVLSYCGGSLIGAAPRPTLLSAGHDSTGENAAIFTAPMATLLAFTGAQARLIAPAPLLTASATFTGLGSFDLTAPSPLLTATGKVSATASASLTAPMATLVGYGGAVLAATGPMGTLVASGKAGAVGSVIAVCPLFVLTASGTARGHGSLIVQAPMGRLSNGSARLWAVAPMATLVAAGSAVVAVTYEAYALNLKHADPKAGDELTRYTNFPFTHIVRYQGSYFGVASDGLYLLEGSTDYAVPTPLPVPWAFKTGMTDFDQPTKKTLDCAYFRGRMGPAAIVTLYAGEVMPTAYAYTTPRGTDAQNYRQKFGHGIKASYYALGATGDGALELDSIEIPIANLTRRI